MRLGYFTMPVHPMHRDWSDTLREDREAIILADWLGFYDAQQPHDEISIMDRLVAYGTVSKVVDGILALREEAGNFGEIVYAGMDWVDPGLAKRSMQPMAEEVTPRANQAIGAFVAS